MADEVQIFYTHLITQASAMNDVSTLLMHSQAEMTGDDVGIDNPADRASLRLAMRSGFEQLATLIASASSDALGLSGLLSGISQRYDELDDELSGRG